MRLALLDRSPLSTMLPATSSPWPQRLRRALQHLTRGLTERQRAAKVLLLAALAGEHVLLFGPSGTGKSILAKRLAELLGGDCFEHLMTPFTVPEELFGPLSLEALQRDELQRQRGYLPDAHVAILDEIFNAGPNLNSLLSLLNERRFDGRKVALWCVVGTCQELQPASGALSDRFLLRIPVKRISDQQVHDFLVSELQTASEKDLGNLQLDCQEACEALDLCTCPAASTSC